MGLALPPGSVVLLVLWLITGSVCAALPTNPGVPNAAASNSFDSAAALRERCLHCHEGNYPRAPHVITFQLMGSKAIYSALTQGLMREYAEGFNDDQLRSLADFLGGGVRDSLPPLMCQKRGLQPQPDDFPEVDGWSFNLDGKRFFERSAAGIGRKNVGDLTLKWAFAYPGATRARSQPVVYAGAVLVGSQDGTVYALDMENGCVRWQFQADTEVRNAISIQPGAEPRAFFGDVEGKVYALDAIDGSLIWKTHASEQAFVTLTGSPRLYRGKLYVPLSSTEWAKAADPAYPCCRFRGGIVAIDAASGEIDWTTHTIPQVAAPTEDKTAAGVARWHPAGVPVWNTPTIDEARGLLYIGTGQSYTSPAVETSDAVLALDIETGAIVWHYQGTKEDAWNMACFGIEGPNCPEEDGPDHDFGAPPMLLTLKADGQVIVAGQKSGEIHGLDPDTQGGLLWKTRVGRGGVAGGVHWGMAANDRLVFAPIADTNFPGEPNGSPRPGLYALDPVNGKVVWEVKAPEICEDAARPACDPGFSAAVTATPELVFAGSYDGYLRTFDADTGEPLWSFNTNREFTTVSGEIGRGGAIEADGPLVLNGHVIVNSGYMFGGRLPGNVLLVFTPEYQ